MKERPILMSAPMVRATLDGSKTQTRRALRDQNPIDLGAATNGSHLSRRPVNDHGLLVGHRLAVVKCPYGQPGDRLWVRETFMQETVFVPCGVRYRATDEPYLFGPPVGDVPKDWRPSIFMPRWASRILLEVVSVRVERLQDISEADAKAEGADCLVFDNCTDQDRAFFDMPLMENGNPYRNGYALLWECINGEGAWAANPWVWVIEFKRVTP